MINNLEQTRINELQLFHCTTELNNKDCLF